MSESPDQLALLRGVIASPDDDLPRLVYADWLEEHGDRVQAKYIRGAIRFVRMSWDDPERAKLHDCLETIQRIGRRPWAAQLGLDRESPERLFRRGLVNTLWCSDLEEFRVLGVKWFDVAPIQGLRLQFDDPPSDLDWWIAYIEQLEAVCTIENLARVRRIEIFGVIPPELYLPDLFCDRPSLAHSGFAVRGPRPDEEILHWV